ncbi:MAG: ATP-binding protein [Candidatus Parabeggiatoa sp. nov. 2]|nr:MAG: ATP-binding protein [Beggiatoa sp. 4572_84]RKZ64444.1 MAG: ATP-binding protein [Gammaproteobacteria bacterium]HEC86170.1 ATP-binding protein [Thioploca sp.]
MTTQIFGDFIEELHDEVEYLKIGFSPNSVPLKQRWRNNGLSADFIADYLQAFFVGKQKNSNDSNTPIPARSKNAVKYIANELLENAMKFSDETSKYPTKIAFRLYSDQLVFHVTNSIKPQKVENFQAIIKNLTHEDPNELYFRRMEANASNENSTQSGLGLLSMRCDYSAKLGWKFETLQTNPPIITVTTMVCLNV